MHFKLPRSNNTPPPEFVSAKTQTYFRKKILDKAFERRRSARLFGGFRNPFPTAGKNSRTRQAEAHGAVREKKYLERAGENRMEVQLITTTHEGTLYPTRFCAVTESRFAISQRTEARCSTALRTSRCG